MNISNLIKDIFEKIKLWFKNLFRKKQIKQKQKKILKTTISNSKINKYKINFGVNDEQNSSSIGTIYPKLSNKNVQLLNKKGIKLKNKVASLNIDTKTSLNNIDEIIKNINENELSINQAIEINNLLNIINNDENLNLNTNQKINILKENISNIIDKKFDDYETNILKKAYNEYEHVNYVIMTTLLIDDLIEEINEITNDFQKNKYTRIEYERKINKIKDKINKLETINNRKEVRDEIENLRKDFYTKKKDKYDLLYNEEVFINLNNKCDELLILVNNKEKDRHIQFVKKEVKEKIQKTQEENKKKNEEKEKKIKEEQEYNENILKRFIDMEFAHKLLLLRESKRKHISTKEDLIKETLNYYSDFIIGEHNEFNFGRNKIKIEITKLYNDINSTICVIEKKDFIPLEHINVKLTDLTEATLEKQTILNNMIEKKYNYNIDNNETNKAVTSKLNAVLNNEKTKENKNNKVLKKEFNTRENTKSNIIKNHK